jgi:isoleucyl-tRNA synthetase
MKSVEGHLKPEDRWLLSRLEGAKVTFEEEMKNFNIHRALRETENFILEDLSRWYVKLIRNRLWTEGADQSKTAAYKVLHESLTTVAKLLAPTTPHISESIYQNLDGRLLSVHMCSWPKTGDTLVDQNLENDMNLVKAIVEDVSKARQSQGIKLRWPVKEVVVKCADKETAAGLKAFESILLEKLNTKKLQILKPGEEWDGLTLEVKPNPEAIGKVYRQWATRIAVILESRPSKVVKEEIDKGEYELGIDGQMIKIQPSMVTFEKSFPATFISVEKPYGSVFIDIETTEEITAEGFAREAVRRIQEMRKEVGMEIEDYLKTQIHAPEKILDHLDRWKEFIGFETRSRSLELVDGEDNEEYIVEWQIERQPVTIGITPLYMKEAVDSFVQIEGMSTKKAMLLFDNGFTTLDLLDKASKEELMDVTGIGEADYRRIRDFMEKPAQRKVKEILLCPHCEAEISPRTVKCPRCDELVKKDMKLCGSCGREISIKADKCYYCGASPEVVTEEEVAPIEPAVVEVTEVAAAEAEGAELKLPELKDSYTYLIKESKSRNTYKLFGESIAKGKKGLCITRVYPGKVRDEHSIEDVPIYWLSNVSRENCIRPKDLEKLSYSVDRFIRDGNAIVLLEGLEYLITNNNFISVLRLIQTLKDDVAMRHAILLLPVGLKALDSHQMSLIEKEMDEVVSINE